MLREAAPEDHRRGPPGRRAAARGRRRVADYWTLIPAFLMSFSYLADSVLMNAAKASGELLTAGCRPS
jgi:hypothetical protein